MKRFVFYYKLLLVLAALLFIWGHSAMSASVSSAESEHFLSLVRPLVEAMQRILARHGHNVELSILVRKLAHFTEYVVLGILACYLFFSPDRPGRLLLTASFCLAAALVDEGIQRFAVDRGPSLRDVGIDFCGACCGLLLMGAVLVICCRFHSAKRGKKA